MEPPPDRLSPHAPSRILRSLERSARPLPSGLLVYGGLAVSLLGVFPVLAILGVIGDGPIEPLGVVFGLIFGALFGGGGGLAVYFGLAAAMESRLERTRPFWRALLQLLWLRITRRSVYAAAPDLLLAAQILWVSAASEGLPWLSRGDLRHLVVFEFFAIHSTAFLGLIAFTRWRGWAVALQGLLFLGFLGLYVFAAHQVAGLVGAIGFGVLTLSKYVSYALRPPDLAGKGRLALRWFTGLVIFMVLSGLFDVDLEAQDNLAFAATYFLALAVFEACDLMAPGARAKLVATAPRPSDRAW